MDVNRRSCSLVLDGNWYVPNFWISCVRRRDDLSYYLSEALKGVGKMICITAQLE